MRRCLDVATTFLTSKQMSFSRDAANAPGPFYVVDQECISCGAPGAAAEGLMSHGGSNAGCIFIRQPQTAAETKCAIFAVWSSCCGAVRFGGSDQEIVRRLSELGVSGSCDDRSRQYATKTRAFARFNLQATESQDEIPAHFLANYLAIAYTRDKWSRLEQFHFGPRSASFCSRWAIGVVPESGGKGWVVRIAIEQQENGSWLLSVLDNESAAKSTAAYLHCRLRTLTTNADLRWFTAEELQTNLPGQERPY